MKVVIAPDSFKECRTAPEVTAALAEGVLAACPDASLDPCPMADGGEGTVTAMVSATGGRYLFADVFDPLGAPMRARLGILGHRQGPPLPGRLGLLGTVGEGGLDENAPAEGGTAVVEMAAACGLGLVPPDRRDPRITTSYGVGGMILAALDAGVSEILIGLGGSATVDGGCGCAQALGVGFYTDEGAATVCGLTGAGVGDVARIDLASRDERLESVRIRAACDVTNPLTGPDGAARVYAPQKGADAETVAMLERHLCRLARLIREQLAIDVEHLAGAGAAGGLGAGLAAFAGASLEPGAQLVADTVGLRRRLAGADLCITGEGRLDAQTARGKTAWTVAHLAAEAGVPVVCIPGEAMAGAPTERFAKVLPLVANGVTLRQAMHNPAALLKERALEAMRLVMR